MQRHGAILLMTLLLIAILSGGISLLMAQSDAFLRLAQRSKGDVEISKVSSDLKRLLPKILSKISSARDLDYAMLLPLSSHSSDGHFTLEASLHSTLGRFNINTIADPFGTPRDTNIAFVKQIFLRYPIASPDVFFNILFDTIDSDTNERQPGSEIASNIVDFHNGSIENFTQFSQIIARYISLTKDRQILLIPWKRLIGFEGDKIDINYASAEIITLIAPQMDSELVRRITTFRTAPFESKEQVLSLAPQLSSVYDTWFTGYLSGVSYPLLCDVTMQMDDQRSHFRFHANTLERTFSRLEIIQ
ncbi:MAG: hypothetical protein PHO27_10215 [Sulfuricurvum sp.]|nr:hypothetical protein [Sulfuricurvum sp.]